MSTQSIMWISYAGILLIAGSLAVALLKIPSSATKFKIGTHFSPNQISVARIPIILFFQIILLHAHISFRDGQIVLALMEMAIGFLGLVFGLVLDNIDGQVFEVQMHALLHPPDELRRSEPNAPIYIFVHDVTENGVKVQKQDQVYLYSWVLRQTAKKTRLPMFEIDHDRQILKLTGKGEWIDSFADKINFFPIFFFLPALALSSWFSALAMVFSDTTSTLIRPPFNNLPLVRLLNPYIREIKASSIGKTKYALQVLLVILAMPAFIGWLPLEHRNFSYYVVETQLWLCVVFGVLSNLSRFSFFLQMLERFGLKKSYENLGNIYRHTGHDHATANNNGIPSRSVMVTVPDRPPPAMINPRQMSSEGP